jgi:hypothetical protein
LQPQTILIPNFSHKVNRSNAVRVGEITADWRIFAPSLHPVSDSCFLNFGSFFDSLMIYS